MPKEMREPTYLVLAALAGGRRHGYALIAEVAQLSGSRVELKVPTLYAALERLAADGMIAPDGDEVVGGRRRRYFRLTQEGAAALDAETARLESNAAGARLRLRAGAWAVGGAS